MPSTDFGSDRKTPGGYGGSAAGSTSGASSSSGPGNSDSGSRYTGSGPSGVNAGTWHGVTPNRVSSTTTGASNPGKAANQAPPTKVVSVVSNLSPPAQTQASYPKIGGIRGGYGMQSWDSTASSIGNARPKPIQDRLPGGKQYYDRVPQGN